jgi:D-sedoheptulose 7-phosphate isomerase
MFFLTAIDKLLKERKEEMSSQPSSEAIKGWIDRYRVAQQEATESIPTQAVAQIIERLQHALAEDRQIFVFGNGGSAANASHFATDLGKGSSDKIGKRFRVVSLNDNMSWITALGNDYAYDQVYVRQLMNYANPGDVVLVMSVSGNSPNVVKAVEWAKSHGVWTAALVGGKRGRLAELADLAIIVPSEHYGRAEDVQMTICHMLCYAFMENPQIGK